MDTGCTLGQTLMFVGVSLLHFNVIKNINNKGSSGPKAVNLAPFSKKKIKEKWNGKLY